eukprot:6023561-Heterocapsa_arctica.AAC.1
MSSSRCIDGTRRALLCAPRGHSYATRTMPAFVPCCPRLSNRSSTSHNNCIMCSLSCRALVVLAKAFGPIIKLVGCQEHHGRQGKLTHTTT